MADSVISVRASTDLPRATVLLESIATESPAASSVPFPADGSIFSREALADALAAIVPSTERRGEPGPILEIYIDDAGAARVPWELARNTRASDGLRGVVRRGREAGQLTDSQSSLESVAIGVVAERKRRGLVAETLTALYQDRGGWTVSFTDTEHAKQKPRASVFHVVGDSESLGDAAEWSRVVRRLGARLFILDVALSGDPRDAWTALADAHELCWRLLELEPPLSILSGTFAASSGRMPQLASLIARLSEGESLDELACELQRFESPLPLDASHRPETSVSLWTAPVYP